MGIIMRNDISYGGGEEVDIVTSFNEIPSDEKVPSEKLVKDTFDATDKKISEIQLFKSPNATIYGNPSINNGQISGFSATDYLAFPFLVDFKNRPFEINMSFTTGAEVTSQQNIIDGMFGLAFAVQNGNFVLALSGDGESWDIGVFNGAYAVSAETNYFVKLAWDGSVYKLSYSLDKEEWTDDIIVNSSVSLYPVQIYIGIGEVKSESPKPFGGIINMNDSNVYIGGSLIWQGMDDVGLATRLSTDLNNIDEAGSAKLKEIAETDKKVNIQQNAEDAGKALVVGEDGNLILGEVSSDNAWNGTHDEWEDLPTEEKAKYKVVYFTDDTSEPENIINDDVISANTAWSSKKITDEAEIKRFKDIEYNILGYNVPDECPIKNEIVDNNFAESIDRIQIRYFITDFDIDMLADNVFECGLGHVDYIEGYTKKTYTSIDQLQDKEYCNIDYKLYIKDLSSSSEEQFFTNNGDKFIYRKTYRNTIHPIETNRDSLCNSAITVISSLEDGKTILVEDLIKAGLYGSGTYLIHANRREQNSGALFFAELYIGTTSSDEPWININATKLAGDGTSLEAESDASGFLSRLVYSGGEGEYNGWRVSLSFIKFNSYSPF